MLQNTLHLLLALSMEQFFCGLTGFGSFQEFFFCFHGFLLQFLKQLSLMQGFLRENFQLRKIQRCVPEFSLVFLEIPLIRSLSLSQMVQFSLFYVLFFPYDRQFNTALILY